MSSDKKDTPLLEMSTKCFGNYVCETSVFKREIGDEERLVVIQSGDFTVLDRDTQHALYLILKNRFES